MNKSKKYKDAQHRSLSEKCKSKPRGTITRQSGWLLSKSLQAINAGEGVEKREPSYTAGGNANQYSHHGEQYGDSIKNWKQNCHMTQQSHCWAYTLRKPDLKETRAPHCSSQHCLHSQDMEATQMPISRRMDKEAMVYIHYEILLSH